MSCVGKVCRADNEEAEAECVWKTAVNLFCRAFDMLIFDTIACKDTVEYAWCNSLVIQ